MILRFQASTSLSDSERSQVLWAIEPEVVVNAEGQGFVPRLRPIAARNDRYNSARRPITHEIDITESPAILQSNIDGWSLREISRWAIPADSTSQMKLKVNHAIVSALRTPLGFMFLVLGTELRTQARFLALVPSLVSIVHVPKESAIPRPASRTADADLLAMISPCLIAMTAVDPISGGETLVVHNPSELLFRAITHQASRKNVRASFMADSAGQPRHRSWIMLDPYMTQSEVAEVLPANTVSFVGFIIHSIENSENEATILSSLPPHCRKETMRTLYSPAGWESNSSSASALGHLLKRALDDAQKNISQGLPIASETVNIKDLIDGSNPQNPVTVVDWTLSKSYAVHVSRLDSTGFFKGDKTYWMCGLSGALGISLCDWMIARGAKYLVLTSRNPRISPDWIEAHKKNGVSVTIIPW